MKAKKGFTLIEVLIVLGVIGVLAGVAYVEYTAQKRASEYKAMRAAVNSLAQAVKNYYYAGNSISSTTTTTSATNNRYLTNIVETTFSRYRVEPVAGGTFRIRVDYYRQGGTSGPRTGRYYFDAGGDQTSCSGSDCMTG
jgi:type IV pilus assembly protein PilE